jgi:hypothetical protein
LAGRKALHILQNIPYSEEELIKKSKNLNPPDGEPVTIITLILMQVNLWIDY